LVAVSLRAENSKNRKRETMPLEGELRDVIEPRRAAAILKDVNGGSRFADGDWVTVTSRRSEITLQAMVVKTIRPDTVFIPYHWPGDRSANRLTHRTLDPRNKIPEFKVSACHLRKASGPPHWAELPGVAATLVGTPLGKVAH
jgi:predicted molibdopterin-dependent oxidoreductase YjgC